jgi:amino acid adenylation domain-containing protein
MNVLIHDYLEQHAVARPDATAVVCLEQSLTYAQLNRQANQLANFLISAGLKLGDRVAIYLDKSVEMALAIYGILKAGGAYVPLDPKAPVQRLNEILLDCDISYIISANGKRKQLNQLVSLHPARYSVVGVDDSEDVQFNCTGWQSILSQQSTQQPARRIIESDLSYIIYTSGSTGIPKGIMHTHQSCLAYSRWAATEYGLTGDDRLGNHSPLHFDISIFDWFAGVVAGAVIIIIPDQYTRFPADYSTLLEQTGTTVLFTVPFALIQLSLRGVLEARDLSALRWIIFGGEPFPIKHLYNLMAQLPTCQFDNMYGPAEINGVTHYTVTDLAYDAPSIPIGRLSKIASALIVDSQFKPVATGQVGELLVRTPTMMQGYWGRADLNQGAFYVTQPNPACNGQYQHSYYRTGDLVSQDSDEQLWFFGRKDRQIKIRGYRVELDEIEAVLVAYDDIEEAAVFSLPMADNTQQIWASYTCKTGVAAEQKALAQHLKQSLPQYAIPAKLTQRQDFPRTTSGKINRTALSQEAVINDSY